MRFIDSHAHLTSDAVFSDIDSILERAKNCGVMQIVNICTNELTLNRGIELSKRHPEVHTVAATTPHDVLEEGESFFSIVEKHAEKKNLVAIGETGLDYFYEHSPKEVQQMFLRRYLNLALRFSLPVVIHCREAFKDFFAILDDEYIVENKHAPGVLHCFTGTMDEAEEVLKRGWYLSLSGIVTFKKSIILKEVAKWIPLDRLLIETDAPYLAPQIRRGERNEPSFIPETARIIAEIKGISIEEVAEASSRNSSLLFNLRSLQYKETLPCS